MSARAEKHSAAQLKPSQTLDIKGLQCPMPLNWASKLLSGLKPGQILEILLTDPSAVDNFESFCRTTGNELVGWSEDDGVYRLLLRKTE